MTWLLNKLNLIRFTSSPLPPSPFPPSFSFDQTVTANTLLTKGNT